MVTKFLILFVCIVSTAQNTRMGIFSVLLLNLPLLSLHPHPRLTIRLLSLHDIVSNLLTPKVKEVFFSNPGWRGVTLGWKPLRHLLLNISSARNAAETRRDLQTRSSGACSFPLPPNIQIFLLCYQQESSFFLPLTDLWFKLFWLSILIFLLIFLVVLIGWSLYRLRRSASGPFFSPFFWRMRILANISLAVGVTLAQGRHILWPSHQNYLGSY